jgi:RHS repeat-associated protein
VVRRSYDLYGHPLDIKSDGLVELEAYQAQQAVVAQQESDLQTLFDTLQPQWDDHHAQMTALIAAAKPHANDAKRLSTKANQLIDEANDALAQARADYNRAATYAQRARQHDNAAKSYLHSMVNHRLICDAPDSTAGQIAFHCEWETIQEISSIKELEAAAEDAQRSNSYAARAQDYQNIALNLYGQAESVIRDANAAERAANNLYAQANVHVEALHDIERQLTDAQNALTQAADKAEALLAAYNGASTPHWTAETINARGDLTRFSQGNGIVTEISHFSDTGRIAAIHATGDPAVPAVLSSEGMQAILDRLNGLISDFTLDVIDYQALADNARADQAAAEQQAVIAHEQAQHYRTNGQAAYATILEAEAFQHEVDAAVFDTRIELNDGLAAIYQQTAGGAASLVLQYESRLGEPGAGRALEAAFHHLMVQHHQAIDALYANLSGDFTGLQTASSDFAAPDATQLTEFADLSAHSRHLANLNQLRADAWQANVVAALDGEATPTTPLSRRALGLDANLLQKQAGIIDLAADATEGVASHAAPLNEINALYQASTGRVPDGTPYTNRTDAYTTRVAQGRRLSDIYAARGVTILAELDAELAQAAAGDDETLDNPFEHLVIQYTTQADLYLEMSEGAYWNDLYATLGNDLADVAGHYASQATENAALADEHSARATTAENAASHQLRLGSNGEIVHESYLYDALGRLTARQDHAADLTETYQYDALSRLTQSQVSGAGAELYAFAGIDTVTYSYDATGNLTHRSDIGAYTYGGTRADGSAIGPHAVTRIDRIDGSTTTFAYDLNGNMTTGDGRAITWTSFDKPASISATNPVTAPTLLTTGSGTGGGTNTPPSHAPGGPGSGSFTYGPERQVVKQVETTGGVERTTYVIGGHYEHLVTPQGETSRFNITYGGAIIAVIENTATEAPNTHYLHTDRLGSVVATTDEHGFLVDRYRYDPFGQRRIAVYDGTASSAENLIRITSRGYTGHRELPGVGLVHMGGRVYHPGIGRFLSADPFIQSPLSSQSYNRYSYLWNSPLNGTDPSGYFSYNPNIPKHLSGYETWKYITSDKFNLPRPTNVNWSLSQARAHRAANLASANLLIQAELPHINRNFSREELYKIGTGQMNIGLSAGAQKRINGVINQAWQWAGLVRDIKKTRKWYRKFGGNIITAVMLYYGAEPAAAFTVGAMFTARANGASVRDTAKAGGKTYIASLAFKEVGTWGNQGAQVVGHAVVGGTLSDWNGGSFTDGAVAAGAGKLASIAGQRFDFSRTENYFATIGAAGIAAEIIGADVGDAILTASIGWFSNFLSQRKPPGTPDNFVKTKSPITGETIWVHPDYVYRSATYSPPTTINSHTIAESANYVSTGFGMIAAISFAGGQHYVAFPASIISLGAKGVEWTFQPPAPVDTFGFYADQLVGGSFQNPAIRFGFEVLNPFQSTIELFNE